MVLHYLFIFFIIFQQYEIWTANDCLGSENGESH